MNVRLIEARKRRGLSVAALADAADVPIHVIYHAQRGGEPGEARALRIAQALGADVVELWPVERDAA